MKTLIKNATVMLPDGPTETSVLIEGSQIAAIGGSTRVKVDETVYATGMHLLPGVIDGHVHFREPGMTHKENLETGSRACAKGGVTTYLEMPNTDPPTITKEAVEAKLSLAAGKSLVNYGFFIGATADNISEMNRVTRTPGIKIFMGSSTGDLLIDKPDVLERIFAETRLPISAHCEDEDTIKANAERIGRTTNVTQHSVIRDEQAAMVATSRATNLALQYDHRLHVLHLSTAAEAALLSEYQKLITAEVCPHHLLLNVEDYMRLGTLAQVNPSLKTADDNERLWQGLCDGHVQVIASDHAPHTWQEKCKRYPDSPSGIPSVENTLALMLDQVNRERCTLQQVVQWMCAAPARVWDMVEKGRIEVGYDADLVLVDMNKTARIQNARQESKCKWSPWHGVELKGWPVRTWVVGHEVYRDGEIDESRRGAEVIFDHDRGGYWATADD